MQGRVIFVTGASAGIGAAAVRVFAREGARVIAAARRQQAIEKNAETLRGEGLDVTAITCDVTNEESVSAAINHVRSTYGRLDGAFNNAGIGGVIGRPIHLSETANFDEVVAVNLRGVFLCMRHEIPLMLESGGGSIVSTSSIGGLAAMRGNVAYAASKWGLGGLTKSAALDYACEGIRVNAIAPGPTSTEAFELAVNSEDARAAAAQGTPMNYIADPEDIARVALFLLSDEARWITGDVLPCDGGSSVA